MRSGARLLWRLGDLGLRRTEEPELLDGSNWSTSELEENFRDIERVNRLLGGLRLTILALSRLVAGVAHPQPVAILDVGTGSADIPVGVARWARRTKKLVTITGLDSRSDILAIARRRVAGFSEITLECAVAPSLPFPDSSFDIVTCSLVAHHLSPIDVVQLLSEMSRVARHAVIVNDLVRNRVSFAVARTLGPLTTRNRLTRNDGPLSIRRSDTIPELCQMVETAGLRVVAIDQFALYRVAITSVSMAS